MLPVSSVAILAFLSAPGLQAGDQKAEEFFEATVRPVLAKNCFPCHTQARMGGLETKSRASMLQGGNSGPAIKPGNPPL